MQTVRFRPPLTAKIEINMIQMTCLMIVIDLFKAMSDVII